ncbi:MAG TPA: hypothetical protein VFQ50_06800, partial [Flavobacterium sp.]|nr:hypothetical protein [Flavobacterium sp.]
MSKVLCLAIFLLLSYMPVSAQDSPALVSLRTILLAMEKQHQITFNFLDDDIATFLLKEPDQKWSLQSKLDYLQQHTQLLFSWSAKNIITVSKNPDSVISGEMQEEWLSEVLIPNYLTNGIAKRTDGSYVVSPQKFGILPGLVEADILQTMQQLPGVICPDEIISNISVRGGTHDQNRFAWNGIRIYQTGHFFGLISVFNPLLPNQITIWKNGTSPFLGESVSSAIHITSGNDIAEKSSTSVTMDMISAGFSTTRKLSEKATVTLSGRRSYTDLLKTPTYQSYAARVFQNTIITDLDGGKDVAYSGDETFFFYDLTAQYRQLIGTKNELTVNAITIANMLQIDQRRSDDSSITLKNSTLQQQNYGGSLSWKTKWNTVSQTMVDAKVSYYNIDTHNESITTNQLTDQQNTVLDTEISLENQHFITERLRISNGYQYNETGVSNIDQSSNPQVLRRIKNVMRSHAAVAEASYITPNGKLSTKLGVRVNYFENLDVLRLEPRLQFVFAVVPNVKLELLGELKSQTLSQVVDFQQDFLGLEKRRWMLADDQNYQLQESEQLSVGIVIKKNNWLVTAESFYKKVNGISSRSQSFQNQLEHADLTGSYNVYGLEMLLQKSIDKYTTWLSYTINNNNYSFFDNQPGQFDNNFEVAHSLSWAASYDHRNLKVAVGSRWFTGKPVTTPASGAIDNSDPLHPAIDYHSPNNERLPDY